jgi:hypothetical protein
MWAGDVDAAEKSTRIFQLVWIVFGRDGPTERVGSSILVFSGPVGENPCGLGEAGQP